MCSISLGLWFKEQINCKTSKSILIDTMVVVAANFHHRRPSSIPKRNQISFQLLPQHQSIKAILERDHKVMSKWRQMTLGGIRELRMWGRQNRCLLADCCGQAVILCYCLGEDLLEICSQAKGELDVWVARQEVDGQGTSMEAEWATSHSQYYADFSQLNPGA